MARRYYGMRYVRDDDGRAVDRDVYSFYSLRARSAWIDLCPKSETRHECLSKHLTRRARVTAIRREDQITKVVVTVLDSDQQKALDALEAGEEL